MSDWTTTIKVVRLFSGVFHSLTWDSNNLVHISICSHICRHLHSQSRIPAILFFMPFQCNTFLLKYIFKRKKKKKANLEESETFSQHARHTEIFPLELDVLPWGATQSPFYFTLDSNAQRKVMAQTKRRG